MSEKTFNFKGANTDKQNELLYDVVGMMKKSSNGNSSVTVDATLEMAVKGEKKLDKANKKILETIDNIQSLNKGVKTNTKILDYYGDLSHALEQLTIASEKYKKSGGTQGMVDVKAWGDAYRALGGTIKALPKEVADSYKAVKDIQQSNMDDMKKAFVAYKKGLKDNIDMSSIVVNPSRAEVRTAIKKTKSDIDKAWNEYKSKGDFSGLVDSKAVKKRIQEISEVLQKYSKEFNFDEKDFDTNQIKELANILKELISYYSGVKNIPKDITQNILYLFKNSDKLGDYVTRTVDKSTGKTISSKANITGFINDKSNNDNALNVYKQVFIAQKGLIQQQQQQAVEEENTEQIIIKKEEAVQKKKKESLELTQEQEKWAKKLSNAEREALGIKINKDGSVNKNTYKKVLDGYEKRDQKKDIDLTNKSESELVEIYKQEKNALKECTDAEKEYHEAQKNRIRDALSSSTEYKYRGGKADNFVKVKAKKSTPEFITESSGQLAIQIEGVVAAEEKLYESQSGQLSLFETTAEVSKKTTDAQIEGQMTLQEYIEGTNEQIKGQISLEEYARQISTNPVTKSSSEQSTVSLQQVENEFEEVEKRAESKVVNFADAVKKNTDKTEDELEHLGFVSSRVFKEIGLSYDEYIKKINTQQRGINWGERLGLISNGKVVDSISGTQTMVGWTDGMKAIDETIDKIIHLHPSGKGEHEVFSSEDFLEYFYKVLSKGLTDIPFELWQNGEKTTLDFSNVNKNDIGLVTTLLSNIQQVVDKNLKENGGTIKSRYESEYQQLYNSLIKAVMDKYSGYNTGFSTDKDINSTINPNLIKNNMQVLEELTSFMRSNEHFDGDWSTVDYLNKLFNKLKSGKDIVNDESSTFVQSFKTKEEAIESFTRAFNKYFELSDKINFNDIFSDDSQKLLDETSLINNQIPGLADAYYNFTKGLSKSDAFREALKDFLSVRGFDNNFDDSVLGLLKNPSGYISEFKNNDKPKLKLINTDELKSEQEEIKNVSDSIKQAIKEIFELDSSDKTKNFKNASNIMSSFTDTFEWADFQALTKFINYTVSQTGNLSKTLDITTQKVEELINSGSKIRTLKPSLSDLLSQPNQSGISTNTSQLEAELNARNNIVNSVRNQAEEERALRQAALSTPLLPMIEAEVVETEKLEDQINDTAEAVEKLNKKQINSIIGKENFDDALSRGFITKTGEGKGARYSATRTSLDEYINIINNEEIERQAKLWEEIILDEDKYIDRQKEIRSSIVDADSALEEMAKVQAEMYSSYPNLPSITPNNPNKKTGNEQLDEAIRRHVNTVNESQNEIVSISDKTTEHQRRNANEIIASNEDIGKSLSEVIRIYSNFEDNVTNVNPRILRSERGNGRGSDLYELTTGWNKATSYHEDAKGNVISDTKEIQTYTQVENEAIRVTNSLMKAMGELKAEKEKGDLADENQITKLSRLIDLYERERRELDLIATVMASLPDSKFTLDQYQAAIAKGTEKNSIEVEAKTNSSIQNYLDSIANKYTEYSTKLADFKSTNHSILSGLTSEIASFEQTLAGLKNGTSSIDDVKNAFNDLKTAAGNINAEFRGTMSKAESGIRTFVESGSKISYLEEGFSKLSNIPDEVKVKLEQLKNTLSGLSTDNIDANFAKKTSEFSRLYDELNNILKQYQITEKANNAAQEKALKEQNALREEANKKLQESAELRANEKEANRIDRINKLSAEEASVLEHIYEIKTKIAQLNPNGDSNEISRLEKELQDMRQRYLDLHKRLKSEATADELNKQIKTESKIASVGTKNVNQASKASIEAESKAIDDLKKKYNGYIDSIYQRQTNLNNLKAKSIKNTGIIDENEVNNETTALDELRKEARSALDELKRLADEGKISKQTFRELAKQYADTFNRSTFDKNGITFDSGYEYSKPGSQDSIANAKVSTAEKAIPKNDTDALNETKAINDLIKAYKALMKQEQEVYSLKDSDKIVDQQKLVSAEEKLDRLREAFKKLKDEYTANFNKDIFDNFDFKNADFDIKVDFLNKTSLSYIKSLEDYFNKLKQNGIDVNPLEGQFRKLLNQIAQVSTAFKNGTLPLENYKNAMSFLSTEVKAFISGMDKEDFTKFSSVDKKLTSIENVGFQSNKVDQFKAKVSELRSELDNLKTTWTGSEEQKKDLEDLINNIDRLKASANGYKEVVSGRKLSEIDFGKVKNIKDLRDAFSKYVSSVGGSSPKFKAYASDNDKLTAIYKNQAGQIVKVTAAIDQKSHAMRVSNEQVQAGMGFASAYFDTWKKALSSFTYYIGFAGLLRTTFRELKEGITTLKEFDGALTNISYTMDLSKKELNELGQSAIKMAEDLGMSIQNAMQVYQIYANMQTTAEEIQKTAMPTAILSNLSGVDTSTAADQVQGILQQFNMLKDAETDVAETSMHVVDVLDKISANISVDYAKGIGIITEAVTATGQVAHDAGMTYEELAAITAKVAERTREDGSSIGNALKTMMTRITKVSKMPQYADEIDEEAVGKAGEALKSIGIETLDASGNFRDMTDILTDLNNKWGSLNDEQQSYIAFQIAA